MLKKILLFLLVGIVSYLCFLVATLPASLVWTQLESRLPLQRLNIDVKAISGSIWKGEALVSARGIETVVSWNVGALGVVTGQLPIDLTLNSVLGQLKTTAILYPSGGELSNTKGQVVLNKLNPLLKRQKLTLNGDAIIESLSLGYSDGVITHADGSIKWTGGVVKYPAGREVHESDYPPFSATLSQSDDDVMVLVRDSQSSVDSIEAAVNSAGIATVKIKRRLLDLSNEPWPKNSTESDVVFKVRRKVL